MRISRTKLGLAALAAAALVAATAAVGVPGAVAQSQPTISFLARECNDDAGKWVAVGSDKVVNTQQVCRVRFQISVPKSYTAQSTFHLQFELGDPFLAPEILRTDVMDRDCKTPATTFRTGNNNFNDAPADGNVATPDVHNPFPRFRYVTVEPDTMRVAGPYDDNKELDLRWPAWQTGDSDPRVWDVTIVVDSKDSYLNDIEYGCFETAGGGRSHVFYRRAMFFKWYLRNDSQPVFWQNVEFVFKDNDNGPYSINHPNPAAQTRAPSSGPAVQAQPSADVAACVLGDAATRSQWAARLVDCLELRGAAVEVRLVPMRATLLRFSDIAQDPNKDDIVTLARYGLALGCEPGKFCGDAKPSETERMAVLMAAMSYGLIDMSMN